jgi:DNA polymerase III epsilon subunit-like protein
MNSNYLCCLDTETDGLDKDTCNLLEIGAVMIDNRELKVVDSFSSLLQPIDLENVNKEALQINHITMDELSKAPQEKLVFESFIVWVNKYNRSKNAYSVYQAPVASGYNIIGYDIPIIRRYCEKYGGWDTKRKDQKIFNQINFIDLMHHIWFITENSMELENNKLTTVLEYMGIEKAVLESAHRALFDAEMSAQILIRLMNYSRRLKTIGKMKNAFAKVAD